MGRVLKGIFEVLLMVIVCIIGLIASNTNPKKREKIIDTFEEDLHDKYAADEISEMEFSRDWTRLKMQGKNKVSFDLTKGYLCMKKYPF